MVNYWRVCCIVITGSVRPIIQLCVHVLKKLEGIILINDNIEIIPFSISIFARLFLTLQT